MASTPARAARPAAVVVEADGGSRGNPGPAAYGAVLSDAATGEVIAERGERIGVATNNVAEYRGLVAGLELYRAYADGADLEVRMDSKLVVEQMSGRWKVKHPDMKPLSQQALELAPAGTTYTWIPRAENAHADRLVNDALDGPEGAVVGHEPAREEAREDAPRHPRPPWEQGPPTVLVLLRHGETDDTDARRFSGSTGNDPGLNATGRAHVAASASWVAPLFDAPPVVLTSGLRRARESAAVLVEALAQHGHTVEPTLDDGIVEAGFGEWEGLTYPEVLEKDPERFAAWLSDPDLPAGGTGDTRSGMAARMRSVRERLLRDHEGRVVVLVTHLTPIKMLVDQVLQLSEDGVFRTEVSPGSVTVLAWYPDGRAVVRLLNGRPGGPVLGSGDAVR